MIAAFLCQLFGGLPYDKQRMARAHRHLQLTDQHFDAFLECVQLAMDTEMHGRVLVTDEMRENVLYEAALFRKDLIPSVSTPTTLVFDADKEDASKLYLPPTTTRPIRKASLLNSNERYWIPQSSFVAMSQDDGKTSFDQEQRYSPRHYTQDMRTVQEDQVSLSTLDTVDALDMVRRDTRDSVGDVVSHGYIWDAVAQGGSSQNGTTHKKSERPGCIQS